MNTINRITGLIHDLLSRIVTLLLGALVVIVTVQIAGRLIPALPYLLWTEEIARFILTWLIFLGSAIGVKEASHFVVDVFPRVGSPAVNFAWDLFVPGVMTAMALIFAIRGYRYAEVLVYDISDIAQIPMIWVGAAIPAFGVLSTLFLLERVASVVLRKER